MPQTVFVPLLAVFGAIVGSYLGTIVLRWPDGRSATTGRSACDGCGRTLRWFEMVPIVFALACRMRCLRCGAPINRVHLIAELLAAVLPAVGALILPWEIAIAYAVMVWIIVPLAMLDARHFWLPDRLTGLLALAGLPGGYWLGMADALDRLIGGLVGYGLLWLLMRGYRALRGQEGLGAGDAKYLGALGLWMGWQALPFIMLLAAGTGIAHVLARMVSGRWQSGSPVPFGLYLSFAAAFIPLLPLSI